MQEFFIVLFMLVRKSRCVYLTGFLTRIAETFLYVMESFNLDMYMYLKKFCAIVLKPDTTQVPTFGLLLKLNINSSVIYPLIAVMQLNVP